MGEEEMEISPSLENITSNGIPVEKFNPFNTSESPTALPLGDNRMAVVEIKITPIEINEFHITTSGTVVSVKVTYDDNKTEVCA